MSIKLVQTASSVTSGTSASATFASNVSNNNLIVMISGTATTGAAAAAAFAPSGSGWTATGSITTSGNNVLKAWWRYANPSDGLTYSVVSGLSTINIYLFELTGIDLSVFTIGVGSGSAALALTSTASVIPSGPGFERFLIGAIWAQGGAMTSPSISTANWTNMALVSGNRSHSGYRKIVSENNSLYDVTFVWTSTNRVTCTLLLGFWGVKTDLSLLGTG